MNNPVPVSGIWLVRDGDYAVVRAEVEGKWIEVIREYQSAFVH